MVAPKYPLPTSEAVPHFSAIVIACIGFLVMLAIGVGMFLAWAVTI